ncbi:MAG: hypothetical protein ABIY55_03935, partial [Kofleriaceae bacterium]
MVDVIEPSIAALEAAIASDSLERWLDRVPEAARLDVRRALELDRPVWTRCPDSVASCLLARILGRAACAALHAGWARELDGRGTPWIAALRPLAMDHEPLARLADREDLALADGGPLSFESDDVLWLGPPDEARADPRRGRWLRWSWASGEETFAPRIAPPRARDAYPRIEVRGRDQIFATLAPGAPAIRVPCPQGSIARAGLMADG